jgi:Xaa-Pro aminopeptidase
MKKLLRRFNQKQPTLNDLLATFSASENAIFRKYTYMHVEPDDHKIDFPLPIPAHISTPKWLNNPNPQYQRPIEQGAIYYNEEQSNKIRESA